MAIRLSVVVSSNAVVRERGGIFRCDKAMELAAAPIGKMGQQDKIFSSPKRLTMEKELAAADSSSPLQRQQSKFRWRSSSFDGKAMLVVSGVSSARGLTFRECVPLLGKAKILLVGDVAT